MICICYILLLHLCVDGHLNCSHLLATVNNTPVNMGVQISVQVLAFDSWRCIVRSGTAGSYIIQFSILCNYQTAYHSSYTIVHSYDQMYKNSGFFTPHWHLWVSVILLMPFCWCEVVSHCGMYLHFSKD